MDNEHVSRLAALRSSTSAMQSGFAAQQWTDADMRAPSLLPGWTRGHVLTHVARNADGITRTLAGALRGELLARYPGGRASRNADIEAGAPRGAAEQLADVRESAAQLDQVLATVEAAGAWDLATEERPAHAHIVARWREVEIHRVDVAGRYTATDWPPEFVDYLLPRLADRLGSRTSEPIRVEIRADECVTGDLAGSAWTVGSGEPVQVAGPDWAVLAWLIGRPSATAGALTTTPELAPWG